MPREKTSVIEVLLFKSVKFSMSEAAAILLKEAGCLKCSRRSYTREEKDLSC